ncbi:hypothetical protein EPO33_05185 [Patescibacteria group bacterium]|nr:MAG: hypothetical protein EPO33_05185 [Patescibacteria group bacterium]
MADIVEYARCNCGGNHGTVPVFVPPGTTQRWCVYGYNAQFSDCPGCKARRKDGKCARGCRKCSRHGWHEGRSCPACATAGFGKWFNKWIVGGAVWTFMVGVMLAFGLITLSGILMTFPFMEMLGQWFIDNGFPVIGWAIILPIPLVVILLLVANATIREMRR